MARIQRTVMVCDGCGREVETVMFRVGGASGNVRNVDLCEDCKAKPFLVVLGMVGATRTTRGRRPAAITAEALEALKADRAAVAAAAKPARKRAARKTAATP